MLLCHLKCANAYHNQIRNAKWTMLDCMYHSLQNDGIAAMVDLV
jgi:hypothetical protein